MNQTQSYKRFGFMGIQPLERHFKKGARSSHRILSGPQPGNDRGRGL